MVLAVFWRKSLIAALVAAFFILSGEYAAGEDYIPVAKRPRGEVLAKGANYLRPDLTRGIVNDYRDLLAWILQIQFNDKQCDEFEQPVILVQGYAPFCIVVVLLDLAACGPAATFQAVTPSRPCACRN